MLANKTSKQILKELKKQEIFYLENQLDTKYLSLIAELTNTSISNIASVYEEIQERQAKKNFILFLVCFFVGIGMYIYVKTKY